jgi:hypothetical protein
MYTVDLEKYTTSMIYPDVPLFWDMKPYVSWHMCTDIPVEPADCVISVDGRLRQWPVTPKSRRIFTIFHGVRSQNTAVFIVKSRVTCWGTTSRLVQTWLREDPGYVLWIKSGFKEASFLQHAVSEII